MKGSLVLFDYFDFTLYLHTYQFPLTWISYTSYIRYLYQMGDISLLYRGKVLFRHDCKHMDFIGGGRHHEETWYLAKISLLV